MHRGYCSPLGSLRAGTGCACRLHRAGGSSLHHSTTIATYPRYLQSTQCVQCSFAPFPSPRTIVTGGAPSLTASATRYEVTLSSAAHDGRLGTPLCPSGDYCPRRRFASAGLETNGDDLGRLPAARRHAVSVDGVLAWAGRGALPATSKHSLCRRDCHPAYVWKRVLWHACGWNPTQAPGDPACEPAVPAKQLGDPLLWCFSPLFAP